MQKNILDQNHYEELGLPDLASASQIKVAIRKLSRQYHPDLNPGDKVAEGKFKRITLAKAVLESPSDKAYFDSNFNFRSKTQKPKPKSHSTKSNQTGKSEQQQSYSSSKVEYTASRPILLSWAEMFLGCDKEVALRGPAGNPAVKSLKIRIQPSIRLKSVRFAGMGYLQSDGVTFGDQIVPVKLENPTLYEIVGKDLVCTVPISIFEAELGIPVKYRHLTGVEKILPIKPGTTSGTQFTFEKLGVPWIALGKSELSGNLIINIKVLRPKPNSVNVRNSELLNELHREFWPSGIRTSFNKQGKP
jgi:DnaJ-class molecular chaperone